MPADDYKIVVENHRSTLTIMEVYSDDEGEYKVEVSNKNGTVTSTAFITVKGNCSLKEILFSYVYILII